METVKKLRCVEVTFIYDRYSFHSCRDFISSLFHSPVLNGSPPSVSDIRESSSVGGGVSPPHSMYYFFALRIYNSSNMMLTDTQQLRVCTTHSTEPWTGCTGCTRFTVRGGSTAAAAVCGTLEHHDKKTQARNNKHAT